MSSSVLPCVSAAMQMSRSVIMPVNTPLSLTTAIAPQPRSDIRCAAMFTASLT
jgi:hypothetical protein